MSVEDLIDGAGLSMGNKEVERIENAEELASIGNDELVKLITFWSCPTLWGKFGFFPLGTC